MSEDIFWYWIAERERIYQKKELRGEEPPWTADPILQEWKFTNVYRHNDRQSRLYFERVKDNFVWKTFVFRMFNWAPTYDYLDNLGFVDEWDQRGAIAALQKRQGKIFTGAYITTNSGKSVPKIVLACQSLTKVYRVHNEMEAHIRELRLLQRAHEYVLGGHFPMIGPFIAYELVSDWRWNILKGSSDVQQWAYAGPGAKRGLKRIFGDAKDPVGKMRSLLGRNPTGLHLEMRDIEHSLCEYDKYMRVKNGEGRPRSRYR